MGGGSIVPSGSPTLSVCPRLSSMPLLVVPSDSSACIRGMVILPSMAGPCASSIFQHSWRVSLLVVIVAIPLAVGNFIIEWIVEATTPKLLRLVRPSMTLHGEWLLMNANSTGIVRSLSVSPIVTLRLMVPIG
ncbi:hypothetical protein Tco_0895523 [Tanacetum coccineum]|uniref:Uncharacterized protein n=1 Tax=Tanacetum coccineum TaxID=301880 RepID=A0ABQ5CET9_9ASTR